MHPAPPQNKPYYRVRDWNEYFENNKTRLLKHLRWVPIPNKHDGDGYTQLVLGHKNGPAHFGAWCAIVQVASKCRPRGTLVRDGCHPHTAASLARKTRFPEKVIAEALPRLLSLGWIETWHPVTPVVPDSGTSVADEWNRIEGKGREGKKGIVGATAPTSPSFHKIESQWNEAAKRLSLPTIKSMTKKRKTTIRQQWKDPFWRENWSAAMTKITESDFLQGGNDRGWRANIDWFLRPDTVSKVMEGAYNGAAKKGSRSFDAAKGQAGKFDGIGTTVEVDAGTGDSEDVPGGKGD